MTRHFSYFIITVEINGQTMFVDYGKEYRKDGKRLRDLQPVARHQDAWSFTAQSKDGRPGWEVALEQAQATADSIDPELKPLVLRAQLKLEPAVKENTNKRMTLGSVQVPVLQEPPAPQEEQEEAHSDAPAIVAQDAEIACVDSNVATGKKAKAKATA